VVTWQFAGGDTLRLVPVTVPKATFLTSMKPLPVTVTLAPPPEGGPALGDTEDSTDAAAVAGDVIVYRSFLVTGDGPEAVTTRRFTVSGPWAGPLTLISPDDTSRTTFQPGCRTSPSVVNTAPRTVTHAPGAPTPGITDTTSGECRATVLGDTLHFAMAMVMAPPHALRNASDRAGRGQQRKHPQLPKRRGQRVRTGRGNHPGRSGRDHRDPRPRDREGSPRPGRLQAGRSRQRDRDIRDRRFAEAAPPTAAVMISTADHVAFWLADANHPAHTSAPVRTRTNATSNRRTLSFSPVHQRRIQAVPARSS
jgi:hypothetical protein